MGPQVCLGCQVPLSRVSSVDAACPARTLEPASLLPLKRCPVVAKTGLGRPSRVSGPCPVTPVCRHDACTLSLNLSLKFRIFPPNGSAAEGLGVCACPQACLLPALAQRGRGPAWHAVQWAGPGWAGRGGHWPVTQPPPRPACVLAPLPGLRPDLLRQVLLQVLHHPQVRHREGGARLRALLRAAEQVSPLPAARGPPRAPCAPCGGRSRLGTGGPAQAGI